MVGLLFCSCRNNYYDSVMKVNFCSIVSSNYSVICYKPELEIEDGMMIRNQSTFLHPLIFLVITERSYEKKTGDEAGTTRLVLQYLRFDHFTVSINYF